MKFICLKYLNKQKWDALSAASQSRYVEDCLDYDRRLLASGHLFATEALATEGPCVGLRCRNGQLVVEDDLKGKEDQIFRGLMFVEARDLNHAIVLVADHPGVQVGWLEIYPAGEGFLS